MSIKTFTDSDINKIYETKVRKDNAYFKKYENLDQYKDDLIESLLVGRDYPRIPCILDFKEWIKKYNIAPNKLLATATSDYELNYIKYKDITHIPYDGLQNDLHTFKLEKNNFDFMLFSQTLEHLYNPLLAVKNIYNHIAPGGYVFTSVPTINIPHMTPVHFSGIYPMGLAILFMSVGFNLLEIGQWGNHNYFKFIFKHHTWPDHDQLKAVGNGIILNEERNVAQCWCLVQKPNN